MSSENIQLAESITLLDKYHATNTLSSIVQKDINASVLTILWILELSYKLFYVLQCYHKQCFTRCSLDLYLVFIVAATTFVKCGLKKSVHDLRFIQIHSHVLHIYIIETKAWNVFIIQRVNFTIIEVVRFQIQKHSLYVTCNIQYKNITNVCFGVYDGGSFVDYCAICTSFFTAR